jgi:hypothetical protein
MSTHSSILSDFTVSFQHRVRSPYAIVDWNHDGTEEDEREVIN